MAETENVIEPPVNTEEIGLEGLEEDDEDVYEEGKVEPQAPVPYSEEKLIEKTDIASVLNSELSKIPVGENKPLSKDYMEMLLKVESQNRVINELKKKICEKCEKECRTSCEEMQIQSLKFCLQQENKKLQSLMKSVVELQKKDPSQPWGEIQIATTFEEDSMPLAMNYRNAVDICETGNQRQVTSAKAAAENKGSPKFKTALSPKTDSSDQLLNCLLEQLRMQNKLVTDCDHVGDGTAGSSHQRRIHKETQADEGHGHKSHRKSAKKCGHLNRKGMGLVGRELARSYSVQEKLVADNADLENERYKLQEQLLCKDRNIECLQQKIQLMQNDLAKLCREQESLKYELCSKPAQDKDKIREHFQYCSQNTRTLEKGVEELQLTMKRLQMELECLKREREKLQIHIQKPEKCFDYEVSCRGKDDELEKLKNNYTLLLKDYGKREMELQELQEKIKAYCEDTPKQNHAQSVEIEILKHKIKDFLEEQDEFKCLIKEQSEQLEDYRSKYLCAQQKVEEQKCLLDKINLNNSQIEEQITNEVQRVKDIFQEKLKEWAHLPAALENEQLKLATIEKEKEELEQKLRIVCREYKSLKSQQGAKDSTNWENKYRELQEEVSKLKEQYEQTNKDRCLLAEKLKITKDELDSLRSESARIVARSKERNEMTKLAQQQIIDQLEKELAQCRATAALSIADRENVIKEMTGQLSCLSTSFEAAQKQIKTLKTHISYLSNGRSSPFMVCCPSDF